jgi:hypothetical protein
VSLRGTGQAARDARFAALAGAIVVIGLLGLVGVPFLTKQRPVHAATPTPPPLFVQTPVRLRAGATACVHGFVLPTDAEVARLTPITQGRPTSPLAIALRGPGYRYATTARGYPGDAPLDVPIRAPSAAIPGQICLRNAGSTAISLVGTTETRSSSRAVTTVDGRPVQADLVLSFFERRPSSLLGRAGDVMRRAAAFHPAPIRAWTFWVLAIAIVVAVPGTALWALSRSLRETDDG